MHTFRSFAPQLPTPGPLELHGQHQPVQVVVTEFRYQPSDEARQQRFDATVHGNTPPSARPLVQDFAVARRLDGRARGTEVLALPTTVWAAGRWCGGFFHHRKSVDKSRRLVNSSVDGPGNSTDWRSSSCTKRIIDNVKRFFACLEKSADLRVGTIRNLSGCRKRF
jgi:hypothetical protein